MELKHKRGEVVNFKGNELFSVFTKTYIWATNDKSVVSYIVQHPDGFEKSFFLQEENQVEGFSMDEISSLSDGVKYCFADEAILETYIERVEMDDVLPPNEKTKTLTINGLEYAKYEMEGEILYMKKLIDIIEGKEQDSEMVLGNIIGIIEKKSFSQMAYLNI